MDHQQLKEVKEQSFKKHKMLHLQATDIEVGKASLAHFNMQIKARIIGKLLSADKGICFSLPLYY